MLLFAITIELKFICWIKILEPDPASTDCWAQGSVPKQIIPPRPMSPVAEIFEERPDDEDEDVSPLYVYTAFAISSYKRKFNIFFCIIVYLILSRYKILQ